MCQVNEPILKEVASIKPTTDVKKEFCDNDNIRSVKSETIEH